ncbi:MAG: AAA family ATPase [Magnetococcales bacterium]|nr:AAA family ATPase [Magnetococcales bacterium]
MSTAHKLASSSPNPKPESWEDVAKLVTMAQESEAYLKYLGLKRNPFPVAPDSEVFFLPTRIDAMITEVLHCIYTRKGFLVITGEVGLGKTTVSRRIMRTLDETRVETALVFNTFIQGGALLEEINRDFGIENAGEGPQAHMAALNRFLIDRYTAGINCAIVIDDAQNLTEESLELVRMISNLEAQAEKLVQILLVGQPELEAKLEAHALRQLKSRIVVHARMKPYDLEELKQYIAFKLNAAGSKGGLVIPENSYRLLQELTGGNPRRVNNLMDRCLYGLFAYNTMRLTRRVILEVAKELGWSRPGVKWGWWARRVGLPLAGAAGLAGLVMMGSAHWPRGGTDEGSLQARVVKEEVEAELAKARLERERVGAELARAKEAREAAEAELARSRTESEKAKEAVARAQVAEAKALTQVANAKELSQVEAAARQKALAEAREAREVAEGAAAKASAGLAEAKTRAEGQEKALREALEARQQAEARAEEVGRKLAQAQAESEARLKELASATRVRQEAEERAKAASADAEQARREARAREERATEEKQALEAARSAREAAEAEARKAREETEAALERMERVRKEAEQAVGKGKAEADARLAEAEAKRKQAEADAARAREEAARIQAAQGQTEKDLVRRKQEAERLLAEAVAAREEAVRAGKPDPAAREQAVARAREEAAKQARGLEELHAARKQAEEAAQRARQDADKALEEANRVREQAAQDVDLAKAEAEKARQELRIARGEVESMRGAVGGAPVALVAVAPEVKQFLALNGLEGYEQPFARALADGWMDGVARVIEEEKGKHLLVLDRKPPASAGQYTILHADKRHYLFWNPPVAVGTFFYGYSGPEVKLLQGHLNRLGMFPHPADGVVGRHTMLALTRYQKERNLPVTGQPDDVTLFWLVHEAGAGASPAQAEAPSSRKEPAKQAGSGNWAVQLASFRARKDAEGLRQRMAEKGVALSVAEVRRSDGSTWYSVRSEAVADRPAAEARMRELSERLGLQGVLVYLQQKH